MSELKVTEQFIINYLNQLKCDDFTSILNKTTHKTHYIANASNDVISKLDDQHKKEYIKIIMNEYPVIAMNIIENDFLDKIDWKKYVPFINDAVVVKCMAQKPNILRSILTKPTEAQKAIIDDYMDKRENKDDFVIVNEQNEQTLEEYIDKEVAEETENNKKLWNTYSIDDLTHMFDKKYIAYNISQPKPITITAQSVCDLTQLSINLIALNNYIKYRKKEELKKLDKTKTLSEEKELWDTMTLVELDDMYDNAVSDWSDKGGRKTSDKETDLKFLRMRHYIDQRRIDERYA